MKKKRIFFILNMAIIIYCSIGIALYYLQNKFLFHPVQLSGDHRFSFERPFKEIQIPVNKTDTISMIKFSPLGSIKKGLVVYYHGNRENVQHYEPYVSTFTDRGYEVWMPDYPGFGKSTGKLTEKKLYELAWLIQTMARSRISSDSIIIYGKSLGTGIAAYAATTSAYRFLILETPYYSIPELFNNYAFFYPIKMMAEYKIPTYEFISDVKSRVMIFHGTSDGVIPYRNARKLLPVLKAGDQFITIPKGKHNNLPESELYKNAMNSILQ